MGDVSHHEARKAARDQVPDGEAIVVSIRVVREAQHIADWREWYIMCDGEFTYLCMPYRTRFPTTSQRATRARSGNGACDRELAVERWCEGTGIAQGAPRRCAGTPNREGQGSRALCFWPASVAAVASLPRGQGGLWLWGFLGDCHSQMGGQPRLLMVCTRRQISRTRNRMRRRICYPCLKGSSAKARIAK